MTMRKTIIEEIGDLTCYDASDKTLESLFELAYEATLLSDYNWNLLSDKAQRWANKMNTIAMTMHEPVTFAQCEKPTPYQGRAGKLICHQHAKAKDVTYVE